MPRKYLDVYCKHCGSRDVRKDAFAAWSVENQQWELASTYDMEFCNDCDCETTLQETIIDAETYKRILATNGAEPSRKPAGGAQ